jgi:hypothetical protein
MLLCKTKYLNNRAIYVHPMSVVTVAIRNDAEQWARKEAGKGKGKLGSLISDAIDCLRRQRERDEVAERLLQRMHDATYIGARRVSREELHAR